MAAQACAVVFDLDGTLVQTRIASWQVFEQVNRRHGLGVDSPEEFFALFRGNIFAQLAARCRDEAHAAEVKQEFLTLLRREYSPPLVPGMRDVVRRLASECTLAVMSSNAMAVLRRVLVDNDIAYCFAHVFGGDVAPDKRAAIRGFLADSGSGFGRRCSADYDEAHVHCVPDASSTVLVTDTAGDVRDAREVGIRVVGVTWGMHSADELLEAGAEFVALWPQEIASHLLGDRAATPPSGACATGSCAAPAAPAAMSSPTSCERAGTGSGAGSTDAASGGAGSGSTGSDDAGSGRAAAGGAGPPGAASCGARTGGAASGAAGPGEVRRQRRRDAADRWQDGGRAAGATSAARSAPTGSPSNAPGERPDPAPLPRRVGPAPSDELLAAVRQICTPP